MNEAEFQELALRRPDLVQRFHHVRRRDGTGFYRRIPKTYRDVSARKASMLWAQIAFAEAAHGVFGKKGLRDGMPIVVPAITKAMKGRSFKKSRVDQAIDELSRAMKEIVVATET